MKPIIGVLLRPEISYEGYEVMCIYNKVSMAVIKNGGIPIGIYPPTMETYQDKNINTTNNLSLEEWEDLKKIIDLCDGIICQGGDDYYDYDIKTIEYAHKINKPLMGICLGMQAMAIAFNGKLQAIGNLEHSKKGIDYAHKVDIKKPSKLFDILKTNKINVNSRHKYKVITTDLDIVGIADDGVVEVIEDKTKDFFIGVQWHPETMVEYDQLMNNLFKQFILSCKSNTK
ncbi:MAG: gamma-glutamyl-gamma-aminobutyrate hydrolase family protein [Bacilli bacterium]|nr:gamma-glutamyl-gamma-aminobutyrate hydrolase family protein [Bacilli bacterium]MDD4282642.1 gamma-glutamyl-gamma-aminobutyrate hydrolase family protein [Bacilli bacterium]MDD4719079.1 gamma-glutamyl-gamma-aminobutyrate hydrolase family protein [Bacilli bacterium]